MKNDKKKLFVLGALALVVVAVGAFQFMNFGAANVPAKVAANSSNEKEYAADAIAKGTSEASANANEAATSQYAADEQEQPPAETDPMRQLYAVNLGTRDPFEPTSSLPLADMTKPQPTPPPPQAQQAPRRPWKGGGEMSIPPMPPLQGSLEPMGNDGTAMPGLPPVPQGPKYSVSGVIRGSENAVVISDAQGNQRLIKEGQDIDGDAKVVSVQKNKVLIRKKDGKTITLSVGGNP